MDPVGGGQYKQAVQQLIEAESQPIKSLEAKKNKEDARLKLFQEFKTKFSGLDKSLNEVATFGKFRELKADLGDGANLASVTLDKDKAEPGQYIIEIAELAARTSVISNGFANPKDPIMGAGYITLNLQNGETTEIYIDDKDSSLYGMASLMNRKAESPVRASVIRDETDPDAPYKLLLTAKKDGQANQVDYPEFYFLDGSNDFYIDDNREAKNAQVTIDGFPIEVASNDIVDFVSGVNLHLKTARPDQPFTLTISEDYQKIGGKLKGLVDQLNQVLDFIVKQNTVDARTDTTSSFAGDSLLQSIESRIRNLIHQGYSAGDPDSDHSTLIHLTQLGVEFDKTGHLTFKEEKFNKLLESNFEMIAEAITGDSGFATQMRQIFNNYNNTQDGLLTLKEKGLKNRIKQIDEQIDQKTKVLERKKEAITNKFAKLETTMANLQRQSQYLSASLPSGGGGSMVSQLIG